MIKKNLIFALFVLIVFQSLVFAENNGVGIDLSYNMHFGGIPAGEYIDLSKTSGTEIRLTFPTSPDYKISLGVCTYSKDVSQYNWSLFGSSSTEYDTSWVSFTYVEILKIWQIDGLPVEHNLDFSKAEVYAGVRYGTLSARRSYSKNYTSSSYSDNSLILKGQGQQIAIPIGIVVPFEGHDHLRFNLSLTPCYSQLPLSGTCDDGREIKEITDNISGFTTSFAFGISWEF